MKRKFIILASIAVLLFLFFVPLISVDNGTRCLVAPCDSTSKVSILNAFFRNYLQKPKLVAQIVNTDNICPFTFARDDMFKLVLIKCAPYALNGVIDGYYMGTVQIQKLDGTMVQTFPSESQTFQLDNPDATQVTASLAHDATGKYVFLDTGTWIVRNLQIFSLSDGRTKNISLMGGVLTKNGFVVYTSADGVKYVHPEIDQPNATDVVSLNLATFTSKVVYVGTPTIDYSVDDSGLKRTGPDLSLTDKEYIAINKGTWKGSVTKLILPISELK